MSPARGSLTESLSWSCKMAKNWRQSSNSEMKHRAGERSVVFSWDLTSPLVICWSVSSLSLLTCETALRFPCGVSLKDRKRSEDLCNLLGINCVADVVRRGRLRWFGHLERKSVDDWVSACRGLVVEGTRGRGRSRKTWEQCVRDDMKLLGLHPEWAVFRDMWRDLIWGKRLTLA